jgi:hypothetical protein
MLIGGGAVAGAKNILGQKNMKWNKNFLFNMDNTLIFFKFPIIVVITY